MRKNQKYFVGYKQGKLEIIKIIPLSHSNSSFLCRCECGQQVRINRGKFCKRFDCGCENPLRLDKARIDLIGKRNGKLLALKWLRSENYRNIWLCKCDCGKYTEVARTNFNFRVMACKRCKGLFSMRSGPGFEEIPEFMLISIKKGAVVRNLEYTITNDYIWKIFLQQNRKCALSGRDIKFGGDSGETTASLDRIDNTKGYIDGNVQWLHKHINMIKNRWPQDYFIDICADIYQKNKEHIFKVEVPAWLDYFLSIAKVVASRSKDAQTQVGAVLTSENRIISTGYNSFPPGMPDEILPNLRDLKYDWISHAEKSCILNSTQSIHQLVEPTIYITMPPCFFCLQMMLQAGIKNIYAIESPLSLKMSEHRDDFELLLCQSNINYYLVQPDFNHMKKILW